MTEWNNLIRKGRTTSMTGLRAGGARIEVMARHCIGTARRQVLKEFTTRREFVALSMAAAAGLGAEYRREEIIDVHQHTHYSGRDNATLISHQRAMSITKTVLLPAGSRLGLDADCHGNDSVVTLVQEHPDVYVCFANEVPDLPEAKSVLERYLKLGACGIGEQKFPVECNSPAIHLVAQIAREFRVPVLLHFQHKAYNTGFLRFHKVLEMYPQVNFIGHAQTWWGNIDKDHKQEILYPKGNVKPGGYTDRLLSDYPNIFGDLSAGSGLNALKRDEEHARGFLHRHRKKLLYGSDCDDRIGSGDVCSGTELLKTLRRLTADENTLRDILSGNAKRILPLQRGRGTSAERAQDDP